MIIKCNFYIVVFELMSLIIIKTYQILVYVKKKNKYPYVNSIIRHGGDIGHPKVIIDMATIKLLFWYNGKGDEIEHKRINVNNIFIRIINNNDRKHFTTNQIVPITFIVSNY